MKSPVFVRSLPEKTGDSDLKRKLQSIGEVSSLIMLCEHYNNDAYSLRSAYFEFANFQDNHTLSQVNLMVSGIPLKHEIVNMENNFAMNSLVVIGLDSSSSKLSIKNHFQKFRVVDVTLIPSETKNHQCAVVTFSKSRDRDAALLRADPIPRAQYRLYPSHDRVFRKIKNSGSLRIILFQRI